MANNDVINIFTANDIVNSGSYGEVWGFVSGFQATVVERRTNTRLLFSRSLALVSQSRVRQVVIEGNIAHKLVAFLFALVSALLLARSSDSANAAAYCCLQCPVLWLFRFDSLGFMRLLRSVLRPQTASGLSARSLLSQHLSEYIKTLRVSALYFLRMIHAPHYFDFQLLGTSTLCRYFFTSRSIIKLFIFWR